MVCGIYEVRLFISLTCYARQKSASFATRITFWSAASAACWTRCASRNPRLSRPLPLRSKSSPRPRRRLRAEDRVRIASARAKTVGERASTAGGVRTVHPLRPSRVGRRDHPLVDGQGVARRLRRMRHHQTPTRNQYQTHTPCDSTLNDSQG